MHPPVFIKRWDIASDDGSTADTKSLIQTIGRAARNVRSRAMPYAGKMADSITRALSETERRRNLQIAYNREHNIIPQTIQKPIREKDVDLTDTKHLPKSEIPNLIIELEAEMQAAAEALDFERAIKLRDAVKKLRVRAAG